MESHVSHNNDRKYYRIAIDTAKEGDEIFNLTEYFKGRVGDRNYGLQMTWYEQGSLKNVKGLKPYIRGNVGHYSIGDDGEIIMAPDAAVVSYVGDPSDTDVAGRVVYHFPEQMFQQEGIFYGFVGLIDDSDGDQRLSGVNIWFKVLAGVAYMGKASAYYIGEMDKLIHNSEEQIRQLLDQGQKDVDAKQAALQTIVDDYKSKMSDLIERLNAQGQTANSMMETIKAGLTALETKIKQDGLFTQDEAEKFKQEINNGLNELKKNVSTSQGLNVKDFGAVGDGTTDDTKAFRDALDKADSGPIKRVLIPDGEYVITKGLIIPDGVGIVGIGSEKSTILSAQGISFLLELGSHSNVTNFTMSSLNNGKDITLLKLGDDGRRVDDCYVDKIYQHGSNQFKTYGVRSAVTNGNIFGNTINVVQEIMYDGVLLSSNKNTWINGNDIDVTTIGYAHSSVYLTPGDDSSLNIAQNNIKAHYEAIPEAEGQTYDAKDIIGVRVEFGDRNHFNLRSWDDDGKSVKALSVVPISFTKNFNNYRDNVFEGYAESDIITNFYTAHANDFSNLCIAKNSSGNFNGDYPHLHAGNFNVTRNLISDDLITNMVQGYSVPIFVSKDVTTIWSTYDLYGSEVQCDSNKGEMYITLNGNDHNLIPGMGLLTVGFDVRFDSPEDLSAITLRAGLSNFQSTTANRMDSAVEGRDIAVDTSMFGYRVVANVNVGDVSAYDTHALTLFWNGLQGGHIKVNRFFVTPGYINASQEVLPGPSSKKWSPNRPASQIKKFQDMFFHPMPDSLVNNPMEFDSNKLSNGDFPSYPVYY